MKLNFFIPILFLLVSLAFLNCGGDGGGGGGGTAGLEGLWFGQYFGNYSFLVDADGNIDEYVADGTVTDRTGDFMELSPGVYRVTLASPSDTSYSTWLMDDTAEHGAHLFDGVIITMEKDPSSTSGVTFSNYDVVGEWLGFGYAASSSGSFERFGPVTVRSAPPLPGGRVYFSSNLPAAAITGRLDSFDSDSGLWWGTGGAGADLTLHASLDKGFTGVKVVPVGATNQDQYVYFALNKTAGSDPGALEGTWFSYGTGRDSEKSIIVDSQGSILEFLAGGVPTGFEGDLFELVPDVFHAGLTFSDISTSLPMRLLTDPDRSHAGLLNFLSNFHAFEKDVSFIPGPQPIENFDLVGSWSGYGYAFSTSTGFFERIEPVTVVAAFLPPPGGDGYRYEGTMPGGITFSGDIVDFYDYGYWEGEGDDPGSTLEVRMTPDKEFVALLSEPAGAITPLGHFFFALNRDPAAP